MRWRLSSAAVGRGEEAGDARVDSRAPRSDYWGEEGEGGEAELLACFDLLLVVGNVGGERRRRGQVSAMARPFLGFAAGGKRRRRESSRSRRACLCSKGGQGARVARGGHARTASMAPVFPLAPQ